MSNTTTAAIDFFGLLLPEDNSSVLIGIFSALFGILFFLFALSYTLIARYLSRSKPMEKYKESRAALISTSSLKNNESTLVNIGNQTTLVGKNQNTLIGNNHQTALIKPSSSHQTALIKPSSTTHQTTLIGNNQITLVNQKPASNETTLINARSNEATLVKANDTSNQQTLVNANPPLVKQQSAKAGVYAQSLDHSNMIGRPKSNDSDRTPSIQLSRTEDKSDVSQSYFSKAVGDQSNELYEMQQELQRVEAHLKSIQQQKMNFLAHSKSGLNLLDASLSTSAYSRGIRSGNSDASLSTAAYPKRSTNNLDVGSPLNRVKTEEPTRSASDISFKRSHRTEEYDSNK